MLIQIKLDEPAATLREIHAAVIAEYPKAILEISKLKDGDPVLYVKPQRLMGQVRKLVKHKLKDIANDDDTPVDK